MNVVYLADIEGKKSLAQAIDLIGGPAADYDKAEQVLRGCVNIRNGELQRVCGALLQFLIIAQAGIAPEIVAQGLNRCRSMLAAVEL